ncbi:hypothetical protein EYF80_059095 [Liparis tanakae]|uniref:Uncharacterized protein n=1 Tax=Liparis tanakae TaxID=230148 RepID=A0A4Z2EPM6_9TELE|nr:hypothetical protein EYF80_059095 [Liparis tanakae]
MGVEVSMRAAGHLPPLVIVGHQLVVQQPEDAVGFHHGVLEALVLLRRAGRCGHRETAASGGPRSPRALKPSDPEALGTLKPSDPEALGPRSPRAPKPSDPEALGP